MVGFGSEDQYCVQLGFVYTALYTGALVVVWSGVTLQCGGCRSCDKVGGTPDPLLSTGLAMHFQLA